MGTHKYHGFRVSAGDRTDNIIGTSILAHTAFSIYHLRWNTFVLNLSFLGWKLLGVLTLGILDIFYTNPYVDATDAELYLALKK